MSLRSGNLKSLKHIEVDLGFLRLDNKGAIGVFDVSFVCEDKDGKEKVSKVFNTDNFSSTSSFITRNRHFIFNLLKLLIDESDFFKGTKVFVNEIDMSTGEIKKLKKFHKQRWNYCDYLQKKEAV